MTPEFLQLVASASPGSIAAVVVVWIFIRSQEKGESLRAGTLKALGDACHAHQERANATLTTALDNCTKALIQNAETQGRLVQALARLENHNRERNQFT